MDSMLTELSAGWLKQLHAEIINMTEDAKQALLWRSARMNESMAFYRGQQWGVSTTFGYYVESQPENEAREAYNYIATTVDSWVSTMMRNWPNIQVVSGFYDMGTMTRASATQRLVKSMMRDGETFVYDTFLRGEIKACVHGAVWYKVYWDPNSGKVEKFPKYLPTAEGEWVPDVDPLGAQRWWQRFEGRIRIDFADCIDVVADPHATSEEEVRYVVERKMVPVSTMDDRYPYDAFGRPTRGRWDVDSRHVEQHERDSVENEHRSYDASIGGVWSGRAESNQLVRLNVFWMKPTNAHPEGMVLAWSGDVIIAISKLPYEWPWVLRNGPRLVPSSLYADGLVECLKPLQRTLNLTVSKRREWIDMILSPPLLVPQNSNLTPDHFSDIAGEVLTYDPIGGSPQWMDVPDIPQSMFEAESSLVSMMKDISAISDITRGEAPPGIETGRALAYLHEFQQSSLVPSVRLLHEVFKKLVKKALRLARDFWPEERVVKQLGESNAWEMKAFYREDYDLDAELEIEIDSGAPYSRALRMAETLEILQAGGYEDTPGAQRFRKINSIDFADNTTVDHNQLQRLNARKEQWLLTEQLEIPIVLERDDPETHLEEHEMFRASDEYMLLPEPLRRAFDTHVAEHEMTYLMQIQGFGSQQQMLGSTAEGPPPPGQPQAPSPRSGGHSAMETMQGSGMALA